jgi:AbiV family abortive infection protein
MKKTLNQYRGGLSSSQAAEGINAACTNARRLAEDAQLLFAAQRFPSAASLAILALEELGKTGILRGLVTAQLDEIEREWKRYRKHTEKNYMALLPGMVRKGATHLQQLRSLFTSASDAERMTYDTVKQIGFYTDCCGNAHWSIPLEVIDEGLAAVLTRMATALTAGKKPVTIKEVELWKLHMSAGNTRENLLNWCSAMVAAGLMSAEDLEDMRQFTQGMECSTGERLQ